MRYFNGKCFLFIRRTSTGIEMQDFSIAFENTKLNRFDRAINTLNERLGWKSPIAMKRRRLKLPQDWMDDTDES
jgi:hypothetical protein